VSWSGRLGGALDDLVLGLLNARFTRARPGAKKPHVPPLDRRALLAEAIEFYGRPEVREGFFDAPPELPRVYEERRGEALVDLKFESPYQPRWPRVRADFLSYAPNRDVYARWFRHPRPAPIVICLHGYRSGSFFVEERAFAARWLYKIGLDVVLFTLPFHARRAVGEAAPVWPSVNVARTNEGFGQAIVDLRALMAWLRTRRDQAPLAVLGMSLGGYTASLLATVENLAFAGLLIPFASYADLVWEHGEGSADRARAEREGITVEMLRRAMEVHAPLLRAPRVSGERVLVVAAEGDRITPPAHAERLARHFDSQLLRMAGGHLFQVGRGEAFRALARRFAELKLIPPRRL
jgi:pimeloyl-ACP methyl ester carboxylesterase